jgi:hypothetical protein
MASDALVPLTDGPSVPLVVVSRLIDLEARGVDVHLQPDGKIFAGPRSAVSETDLEFIRQHRPYVVAALLYIAQQEARPQ